MTDDAISGAESRRVLGYCIACKEPLYAEDALDDSEHRGDAPFMHRGCGW